MSLTRDFLASQSSVSLMDACRSAVTRHFPNYASLRDFASLRSAVEEKGIGVRLRESRYGNEGMIEFRPSGRIDIVVRRDVSIRRQRFTLAHEIGHWIVRKELFAEVVRGSESAFRAVAFRQEKMNEEERLVNLVAAELLLPQECVRPLRSMRHPGGRLKAIRSLCLMHQVSRVMAIRRVADVFQSNVLWLQLVPFRFNDLSSAAEVDDAMVVTAGESTLYAGDSTRLVREVRFQSFRDHGSLRLAVQSPKGFVDEEFDVDVALRPVPHAFAMTFLTPNKLDQDSAIEGAVSQ